MKTKLSYHKQNIIAILALVLGCFAGSAQITTQPDKGYTFKNTCVDFYPANNDSLAFPITYKASVSAAALHGTLTIDSTMPFKATYCPFANYIGKDTMYYRICDNSQTICGISSIIFNIENQSISNIWPGDFNHDGTVNSFDLLFLANSMNTQGSPAFNRTNNWAPSFCDDWNINTWGINNKYIDADGNGMIDLNDIAIFQSNIDKTRTSFYQTNNFNPYKTNTYMPLSTKVRKFNLAKGDTIEVDLFFGDTSGLIDIQKIITGFSCLLTIDSAFSIAFKNANAWFESNNNWITKGLGANKISFVSKKTNRLAFDLGFSRTDHYLNKTNYGAGCNQLTLMITTKDKTSNTDLAEIYTSVSGGASPYNYFWSNGATVSTISGLNISNPTSNTVTIVDANNCTVSGQVTVMDRSGNGRGELGTLKVIVDDDIYQLSNVQNLPINFIVANPYLIDNLIPEFVNIIKYQAAYGKPTVGIQAPNSINSYLVKNKTNSVYEIEFSNAENIDKIYITDITGKELFVPINIENNKATIDLHALSSQMYIAIVNTTQELYTIKLSK